MATTNIYLNFNGNCSEAFNFYKSVFGIYFGMIKDRFGVNWMISYNEENS
jgi:PhnB protein